MSNPTDIFCIDNPQHEFNREALITLKIDEIFAKMEEGSEDYCLLCEQENMYGASDFIDGKILKRLAIKYGVTPL